MKYYSSILEAIGNTPLVKLSSKIVPSDSADVFVKCEYMNPTGSIKDRMAYYIIKVAEEKGWIKPGGTIVENTSGNTGLGLAMIAAVKGYKCVLTMPDKMSSEKVNMLKAFGAEVVITPTDVEGDSPEHYVNVAKRIAKETPNAFYVNQYHTELNREAHYNLTGPEIWEQSKGEINAFVAGTGTGGTISGVGKYLKEKSKDILIVGVDPIGSVHYHYFYTKTLPTPHVYKVEGIGEDILCNALDFSVIDKMYQVSDKECFQTARDLVKKEGLFCGGASGGIVYIALKVAKELGKGKKVVTVLTDSGNRYITKFLSDEWMKDYGFLDDRPELGFVEEILNFKKQKDILTALEDDLISTAINKMQERGVSQLPVVDSKGELVGIVAEIDILRAISSGKVDKNGVVKDIARENVEVTTKKARIEELFSIFDKGNIAIVAEEKRPIGVLTKIDLLAYLNSC